MSNLEVISVTENEGISVVTVTEPTTIVVQESVVRGLRGLTGPAGLNDWIVITDDYSANNRDRLIADTSNGAFTVTLPVTANTGDYIQITDGADWGANYLFIDPNGATIENFVGTMNVDVKGITVELIYDGSQWQVTATLGARGYAGIAGPQGPQGPAGAGGGADVGDWAFNGATAYSNTGAGLTIAPSEGNYDGGVYLPYANEAMPIIIYNNSGAGIQLSSDARSWTFNTDGSIQFPGLNVQRGDDPSGTIYGYTLRMGDGEEEAIITTPDGIDGIPDSQRLVINPGRGYDNGEGGDIYLWAGRGGENDGSGGDVKIRGGQGMANGSGGYIRIEAGDAQNAGIPGYIQIAGGYASSGEGGNVDITGGSSGDGTSHHGNVNINSGGNKWKFENGGNLSLPGGGIIYSNPYTPSGAPGNTITLQPAGSGAITDQKLLVYPTAADGDHIHLTSGNLYQTELFFGNDNFYVKLANTGDILINSNDGVGNTGQWIFDANGVTRFPSDTLLSPEGLSLTTRTFNGNAYTIAYQTSNYWEAYAEDDLSNPYASWAWIHAQLPSANTPEVFIENKRGSDGTEYRWTFAANGTLSVPGEIHGAESNVTISTSNKNWVFEDSGRTILPAVGTYPSTARGAPGDKAGMFVIAGAYIYHCYADYTDGSTPIWQKTVMDNTDWD